MSAEGFSQADWAAINALPLNSFGLPSRRTRSLVLGTFNMLKLGDAGADAKRWAFLRKVCARFDFLAVQEVMDNLSGLQRLCEELGAPYQFLVSDTTGKGFPRGSLRPDGALGFRLPSGSRTAR